MAVAIARRCYKHVHPSGISGTHPPQLFGLLLLPFDCQWRVSEVGTICGAVLPRCLAPRQCYLSRPPGISWRRPVCRHCLSPVCPSPLQGYVVCHRPIAARLPPQPVSRHRPSLVTQSVYSHGYRCLHRHLPPPPPRLPSPPPVSSLFTARLGSLHRPSRLRLSIGIR